MNISNNNASSIEEVNKQSIIAQYFINKTKKEIAFLCKYFTDRYYYQIYDIAVYYTKKNSLSLTENYTRIIDSYANSFIVSDKTEEKEKNKVFGSFIKSIYESYMKYIDNQIISIDDFISKINGTFIPDSYKDEIYLQNKSNVSILFHNIVSNIAISLKNYLLDNINIFVNRIDENYSILYNECLYIVCSCKNKICLGFNQNKEDDTGYNYENLVKNSIFYNELLNKNRIMANDLIKSLKFIRDLKNTSKISTGVQTDESSPSTKHRKFKLINTKIASNPSEHQHPHHLSEEVHDDDKLQVNAHHQNSESVLYDNNKILSEELINLNESSTLIDEHNQNSTLIDEHNQNSTLINDIEHNQNSTLIAEHNQNSTLIAEHNQNSTLINDIEHNQNSTLIDDSKIPKYWSEDIKNEDNPSVDICTDLFDDEYLNTVSDLKIHKKKVI